MTMAAHDECRHGVDVEDDCDACDDEVHYQADLRWDYNTGHLNGAAVAFGLMGMAEAIRSRLCPVCDEHTCNHWSRTVYG